MKANPQNALPLIEAMSDGALDVLLATFPRSRMLLRHIDRIAAAITTLAKAYCWTVLGVRLPLLWLDRRRDLDPRSEARHAFLTEVLECLSFTEARTPTDVVARLDRTRVPADMRHMDAEQLEDAVLPCLRLIEALGEAKATLMARTQYVAQFGGTEARARWRVGREFDRVASRYSECQQIYIGRPLVFTRLGKGGLRKRSHSQPLTPLAVA